MDNVKTDVVAMLNSEANFSTSSYVAQNFSEPPLPCLQNKTC